MINLKFLLFFILAAFSFVGCAKILEPVSIILNEKDVLKEDIQQEFSINIQALNFENARIANKKTYQRKLMLTGSGSRANVYDEIDFLKSNFPDVNIKQDYVLGSGDQLFFQYRDAFVNGTAQWPYVSKQTNYSLGVGDELTLIQFTQSSEITPTINLELNNNLLSSLTSEKLLTSKGIIGSDGNVLLLGAGNIKAENRTLTEVRDEVRNIFVRNGSAPNFQLEITEFRSKKANVAINSQIENLTGKTIPISNLTTTLKEIVLKYGISAASQNSVLIMLIRDGQSYNITAGQLFEMNSPDVIIKDKDQIEIQLASNKLLTFDLFVGKDGKILLPDLGFIDGLGRSIKEVEIDIQKILKGKKIIPDFQLELIKSDTQKAYIIQRNSGNISANGTLTIPLRNSKISLKETLLDSGLQVQSALGLSVVELSRNKKRYLMTVEDILDSNAPVVWIENGDQIELIHLEYKPGQVYALSGTGNATIIPIYPSKRETLADALFVPNGALGNPLAKRSEVYLLRGQSPSVAYHLDAQNVSRILVAAKLELRPNDIIFVADRPIISFSRVLSEITPLRMLLRDIKEDKIP